MKNELASKIRVATPLTWRERLAGLHAGASGLPFESYRERIRAATLDQPARLAKAGALPAATAGRAGVVELEAAEVAKRREDLAGALPGARDRYRELEDAMPALVAEKPSSVGAIAWTIFAAAIVAGDGACTYLTVADAFGVDLAFNEAASFTITLVALMTLLAVLANFWAGVRATDRGAPIRRFWGWAMLVSQAVVLAVLRAATSDGSVMVAALGFMAVLVGGWAAGEVHHRVAAYFADRTAHTSRRAAKENELTTAAARLSEIENGLAATEEQRRALASESEELDRLPDAHAARDRELRGILAARVATARYYYDLGATVGGRRHAAPARDEDGRDA